VGSSMDCFRLVFDMGVRAALVGTFSQYVVIPFSLFAKMNFSPAFASRRF